jgi:predicted GIY-YIG superfamily endonuclease
MTLIKDHENRQLSKYFKKDPGERRRVKKLRVTERQEKLSKCSSTSKKFKRFVRENLNELISIKNSFYSQ